MNIKFKYMYRDYGNYKSFEEVNFSNQNRFTAEQLNSKIERVLIDRLYFTVSKVCLPDLHFDDFDDELDHNWHEFEGVEETNELPTDEKCRDIEEFLNDLSEACAGISI